MPSFPCPHFSQISQLVQTTNKKHLHTQHKSLDHNNHNFITFLATPKNKKQKLQQQNQLVNFTINNQNKELKFNYKNQNFNIKLMTHLLNVTVCIPVINKICHSM
jgi:hypothetical protein